MAILSGHIQVLARPLSQCTESLARWIIEFCPGIHTTLYKIADQYAGNGAVGHTHSTVASCYIDMLIAWVPTDECKIIVGFQDLARPAILEDASDSAKSKFLSSLD